jgi:hypothetical protein
MPVRVLILLFAALAVAGPVHATPTLFTFDDGGLSSGDGDLAVSAYMSSLYSSLVVVNGSDVHSGDGFGPDLYLWTRAQLLNPGNIRIILTVPTTSVSFDGYIFDATSGADFTFTASNSLFGPPVFQQSWNTGTGTGFSFSSGPFTEPAYILNFSDSGKHDVGIDNLVLAPPGPTSPVPVPGAALLGLLGAVLVRSLRHHRTL